MHTLRGMTEGQMEQYDVVVEVRMVVEAASQDAADTAGLGAIGDALSEDELLFLSLEREGIRKADLWCDGKTRCVQGPV